MNTLEVVRKVGAVLGAHGWRMAAAESCTGGLVSSMLTDVAGSSFWFEGAVVAYDNRVKTRLLGVPEAVLREHGAVSRECVEAMAQGARELFSVPVALAVSGIAGPGGGSAEKPVGTVWIAWAIPDRIWSRNFFFEGERAAVKEQTARVAVEELALFQTKNSAS